MVVRKRILRQRILDTLEHCPLLCREVIVADGALQLLAQRDMRTAVEMLGKALLHCDWIWPIVREQLLTDKRVQLNGMLPELFDCPEFFAILREGIVKCAKISGTIVSRPELTVPQLLAVDPSAVVSWMRAIFSMKTSAFHDLFMRWLAHTGAEKLLVYPAVAECFEDALIGDSDFARHCAVYIVHQLGPTLLDFTWVVDWCKRSVERKKHLKDVLALFESVGERGLSCDWLLTAVKEGLQLDWYDNCQHAVNVISSVMPYIRKHGREYLLGDWLTVMADREWKYGFEVLSDLFRVCPIPLLEVDAALSIMRRFCEAVDSEYIIPEYHYTLPAALIAACGPTLLGYRWFTDWLSPAAGTDYEEHEEAALRSLQGMGSAVLTCEPAMTLLRFGVSFHLDVAVITIIGLCDDEQFRQDARTIAILRKLVRENRRLSVYLAIGVPIIVNPGAAEAGMVSDLLSRGKADAIAASFARLTPGCGTLQQFALDARILRSAVKRACISYDGDVMIVESSAGRFEHCLSDADKQFMLESRVAWPDKDNLAGHVTDCAELMSSGGLEMLYARMDAQPYNVDLQLHGCDVIARLSARKEWANDGLISKGIGRIFAVMDATRDVVSCQRRL